MELQPKQRYIRYFQGLREKAKAIRQDPEREAAELERTADTLEAQLPLIFAASAAEKKSPARSANKKTPEVAKQKVTEATKTEAPEAAKADRGHYADDLHRFLATNGPSQVSRDIIPHLRTLHGDAIEPEPVRKLLKRAHRNGKSLVMRSPDFDPNEGVYMMAKNLDEKRQAYPEVYAEKAAASDPAPASEATSSDDDEGASENELLKE